jgi:hypothetical protein
MAPFTSSGGLGTNKGPRYFFGSMKIALLLLFTATVLLGSGCATQPTIDEQAREETQQHQVEKRSDAFARTLQP